MKPDYKMRASELALFLALWSTWVLLSEPKQVPIRYTTEGTDGSDLVVYPSSWQCEIDALEEEGVVLDSCEEAAMDDDEFYVKHGGACTVVVQDSVTRMPFRKTATCHRGRWLTSETRSDALDLPHHRQKRFIFAIIGCIAGWWCNNRGTKKEYVLKKPPSYSNCPPSELKPPANFFYTPPGQTALVVSWSDPIASDSDGTIVSDKQETGKTTGELFHGLPISGGFQYTILYKATDNDGMSGTCSFTFAVEVRTCGELPWPSNGQRVCNKNNILGSTCKVSCNEGYTPVDGISETTCSGENNPKWSEIPSCKKISCNPPPDVTNGNLRCSSGHEYGAYCVTSCYDGYTLQGQVFTRCEANGKWFSAAPTTCTDGVAPEITCKTPQIFYADRASLATPVKWDLPSATDNIDPNPVVTQRNGPEMGAVVEAGSSAFATYTATDAAGNQSPSCNVELRVEVTSCGHPLDTLTDDRLRFACTITPQYIYGDTCTLTCGLNLPLEGTNQITCERNDTESGPPVAYWDWGSGDMPYCQDISCPDMLPPRNGALVFDRLNDRPTSTMLCNAKYTLAVPEFTGFTGVFICQDSGFWNPNYLKAPDCSVLNSTRAYKLPGDFFYYDGICGVNDTILDNFEKLVENLDTIYAPLCPNSTVCKTQNPKITCGEYRKKRSEGTELYSGRRRSTRTSDDNHVLEKRQTDTVLRVSFEIVVFFDTSNMTNEEQWDFADYVQLDLLKPAIQTAVDNGTFDRPGWSPLDSFQTAEFGDPACDPGSVLTLLTKCSECPAGHFATDSECVKCPIGEYCDRGGCSLCTACPDGYSTRDEATESLDNCTQLCEPGSYSPDTFAPCALCEAGTYQPQTGQTYCLPCPIGTSTKSGGTIVETNCQAFDAIFTDTGGHNLTVGISTLTNLGLEFFVKTVSGKPDIVMSVNGVLEVTIAETINVSTAATVDELGESSGDAWIHVSIYWDVTTGKLKAFYRNNLVVSHSSVFPTTIPLVQNGQLIISASGNAVAISGLRLRDTLLAEEDNITATTCQNINATDVVNMENLKFLEEITLLVPSVCDVVDECLSSPCGEHSSRCINNVEGFTCTCKGGWTGVSCETPPDYCLDKSCQNGATCISRTTNYTCQCKPGFSGVNCEVTPVNGDWSKWSEWTECSATCNTGSRERTRSCDSPAPDPYGQDCVGVDVETENCNTSPCPECPTLERGYGSLPKCSLDTVTGTKTCTATCVSNGHVLLSSLGNKTYTCGRETGYSWQPNQKLPGCSKPSSPRKMEVRTSASLVQTVPPEDQQAVIDGITSNFDSTACNNSSECKVDVQLGGEESSGSKRKRNTGTTVTVAFSISLTDTSDLQLEQLIQNKTISPAVQEIIDAVNNLEATVVAINDSVSTYFDVTTDGVTYTVDTNTVTFDGAPICSEGKVVTDELCVECPAGSYQAGDYCSLCNAGTYQDLTGQTSCVQCPTGFITITVGADSIAECSVLEATASSSTQASPSSTSMQHNEDGEGVLIIVIVVVSVLIVVIIGIIATTVFLMKHSGARTKVYDTRPTLRGATPNLHGPTKGMQVLSNPVYSMPPGSTFFAKSRPLAPRPSTTATVRGLNLEMDSFDNCNTRNGNDL